ncbi:hypothetical protein BN1723_020894, partial [Verticillium longisporum]
SFVPISSTTSGPATLPGPPKILDSWLTARMVLRRGCTASRRSATTTILTLRRTSSAFNYWSPWLSRSTSCLMPRGKVSRCLLHCAVA